ncbi:hypothetical protein ebA5517 [Aromatoleum aromaticum EbN1]|uniref:Uncharacterized protein n=1 Tax=Aromatoleum aromaticum (strain DSM 19018 / LMG 30748 / EbN1) TaxID=76114 RepID=Q5P098_AROAE|nr:hypothetical protein ebA5517 [Aromatoleum aromaticum EbN1]
MARLLVGLFTRRMACSTERLQGSRPEAANRVLGLAPGLDVIGDSRRLDTSGSAAKRAQRVQR